MRGAMTYYTAKSVYNLISIHAPHAGSDDVMCYGVNTTLKFQSTLPMRGAISLPLGSGSCIAFQSTLPMRGAICDPLCKFIFI